MHKQLISKTAHRSFNDDSFLCSCALALALALVGDVDSDADADDAI